MGVHESSRLAVRSSASKGDGQKAAPAAESASHEHEHEHEPLAAGAWSYDLTSLRAEGERRPLPGILQRFVDRSIDGHPSLMPAVPRSRPHLDIFAPVQARLRVGSVTDPLEHEADVAADRVVQALSAGVPELSSTAGELTPASNAPVQRQLVLGEVDDPLEREAELAAREAVALGSTSAAPSDDDEPIQAKRIGPGSSEVAPDFTGGLAATTGGGSPLPAALRTDLEGCFAHDFADVRVHTDGTAARLADSIGAAAFTRGTDVYFGPSSWQPDTPGGLHLLAHELAHVVQQRGTEAPVRRRPKGKGKGAAKKTLRIGYVFLYDAKGVAYDQIKFNETKEGVIPLPDGVYEVKIEKEGKTWMMHVIQPAADSIPLDAKGIGKALKAIKNAKKLWLEIQRVKPTTTPAPAKTADKPKAPEELGVFADESHEGELTIDPSTGDGSESEKGATGEPKDKTGDQPKDAGTDAGTGKPGTKDAEPPEPGAKTGDKARKGSATSTSSRPGSKYGWLGWLDLPESWIRALETAFEALGDAEEFLALQSLFQTLAELAEHRGELVDTFRSADNLLEAALGIKDNLALDALETWALTAPPKQDELPDENKVKSRGILGVAQKVLSLVRKLRRILHPIFVTRAKIKTVFQGTLLFVAGLDEIEDLMDVTQDIGNLGTTQAKQLIGKASTQLGERLHGEVASAQQSLALVVEHFSTADLVSYEDVARVVTAAAIELTPQPYKLGAKLGKKLGLDTLVADKLVAKIIPKVALEGINGALNKVTKSIKPAIDKGTEAAAQVVDGLGEELSKQLPSLFTEAFAQADRRPGAPSATRGRLGRAERALAASSGAPLPAGVREDLEGRLGFDLADVRIHADGAAARANQLLGANALTVGRDVYFDAGRFQPGSPDGLRLLAHELTHVEQQAALPDGTQLAQGDWKSLRAKLIAKFGVKLKEALSVSRTGSKDVLERAGRLREWIDKKQGKKVTRNELATPDFKAAYVVIDKGNGKISLRRKPKYYRHVPGLTINTKTASGNYVGTLKLGVLARLAAFNPDNRARAELRRNLNCSSDAQAHHLIPLELKHDPIVELARKNGWNQNAASSGVCLKTHEGSHPIETGKVRRALADIYDFSGDDWSKAKDPFFKVIRDARARVNRLDRLGKKIE
jgi:hypothetical protein